MGTHWMLFDMYILKSKQKVFRKDIRWCQQ